jgi:hypothetical protein
LSNVPFESAASARLRPAVHPILQSLV